MKKFIAITISPLLLIALSACSKTVEEAESSQSGIIIEGTPGGSFESEQSSGIEKDLDTKNTDTLISETQFEIGIEGLEALLDYLSSHGYTASKALEATGLTADEIIAGGGDQKTRDILYDLFPPELIANDGATLEEELVAYAYLAKISELFNFEGIPLTFVVNKDAAVIEGTSIVIPEGGEGISPSRDEARDFMGIIHVISVPWTITQVDKNDPTSYASWGVDIAALAKSVKNVGTIDFTFEDAEIDFFG